MNDIEHIQSLHGMVMISSLYNQFLGDCQACTICSVNENATEAVVMSVMINRLANVPNESLYVESR